MFEVRLKEMRQRRNISQTQLALKLHVTPGAVSQWEKGLTRPTFETLDALAETLNTTMAYLLGETNDPRRATNAEMSAEYEAELEREQIRWSLDDSKRTDPDRRTLFLLAKYGSENEVRIVGAIIKALQTVDPTFKIEKNNQ